MYTKNSKLRRQIKVRSKIKGTKERPRLSVFRSNRYIYAQIIDDIQGKTVLGVSEKHLETTRDMKRSEKAKAVGLLLAKKALQKKVKKIVFDRGSYSYRGRVAALAGGAREGGLKF